MFCKIQNHASTCASKIENLSKYYIKVHTVYPKKYAHGFCFAVLCCGHTLTDFPISIRLTSLALWQSNDCPSASKATLMNMDEYFMWIHYEQLHNHNKAKHNKTVCIFLGIYCTSIIPMAPPCMITSDCLYRFIARVRSGELPSAVITLSMAMNQAYVWLLCACLSGAQTSRRDTQSADWLRFQWLYPTVNSFWKLKSREISFALNICFGHPIR